MEEVIEYFESNFTVNLKDEESKLPEQIISVVKEHIHKTIELAKNKKKEIN